MTFLALLLVGWSSAQGEILMVDASRDRISLLSSFDGSFIDPDFIVFGRQGGNFTPTSAIPSGRGTIFVSDQFANDILEYTIGGSLAPTTFVSNTQISNPRGIAVHGGGLFVTSGSGSTATSNTIQRFDLTTGAQSTFINTVTPGGTIVVDTPWDILFRANDVLVMNGTNGGGSIQRFDLAGNHLGQFSSNPVNTPRQLNELPNGDIIVGNVAGGGGIVRFNSTGQLQEAVIGAPAFGVIGLENGNLFAASGINTRLFDPLTGITTEGTFSGSGFRYLESIVLPVAIPEPSSVAILAFVGGVCAHRRRRLKSGSSTRAQSGV